MMLFASMCFEKFSFGRVGLSPSADRDLARETLPFLFGGERI